GFAFAAQEGAFAAALKLKDLTDQQRQSITALQDDLNSKLDRLAASVIEEIDKFRKDRSPFDAPAEQWQQQQQVISEFQSKEAGEMQTAFDSLRGVLGPELTGKLPASAFP